MNNLGDDFANISGGMLESAPDLEVEINDSTSTIQAYILASALLKQELQAEYRRWFNNMSPFTAEDEVSEHCYGAPRGILLRNATPTIYKQRVITSGAVFLQKGIDLFTDNVIRVNNNGEQYKVYFTPTRDIELTAGEHDIEVVCTKTGDILASLGSINVIVAPKENLISVSNTELISVGTEIESRQKYNARIMNYIVPSQGTKGTRGALINALESDEGGGCVRAVFYNDADNLDEIPKGWNCIVCYGGNEDNIFKTLEQQNLSGAFYGKIGLQRQKYTAKEVFNDRNGNVVQTTGELLTYNVATTLPFDIKVIFIGEVLMGDFINDLRTIIDEKRVCDFQKEITKSDILFYAIDYMMNNLIVATKIKEIKFFVDGVEKQSIKPNDCFTIPVLSSISVEYE